MPKNLSCLQLTERFTIFDLLGYITLLLHIFMKKGNGKKITLALACRSFLYLNNKHNTYPTRQKENLSHPFHNDVCCLFTTYGYKCALHL